MSSSNNIRSSQLGQRLEMEWNSLVEEYLPVREEGSIWRSSESAHPPTGVNQGWKLHVSATLLSATDTLRRCAAILGPTSTRWKAPQSLEVVRHLNAGLYHGYSQIGKIITVYAGEADIARQLASAIDEALIGSCGPAVPFDVRFRQDGVVYFRYGVIDPIEEIMVDGHKLPAIRHPSGHLEPDRRAARHAVPDWLEDTI